MPWAYALLCFWDSCMGRSLFPQVKLSILPPGVDTSFLPVHLLLLTLPASAACGFFCLEIFCAPQSAVSQRQLDNYFFLGHPTENHLH